MVRRLRKFVMAVTWVMVAFRVSAAPGPLRDKREIQPRRTERLTAPIDHLSHDHRTSQTDGTTEQLAVVSSRERGDAHAQTITPSGRMNAARSSFVHRYPGHALHPRSGRSLGGHASPSGETENGTAAALVELSGRTSAQQPLREERGSTNEGHAALVELESSTRGCGFPTTYINCSCFSSHPGARGDRPHRKTTHVLIIRPGFGWKANPGQKDLVLNSGYVSCWIDCKSPEELQGVELSQIVAHVWTFAKMQDIKLIMGASKGGVLLPHLWQNWESLRQQPAYNSHMPSVLPAMLIINLNPLLYTHLGTHETVQQGSLRLVVAQGGDDETYVQNHGQAMDATKHWTHQKKAFLYWGGGGYIPAGTIRVADTHNMKSLLEWETLPRLMDAAVAEESPEMSLIRSGRDFFLSQERIAAEKKLTYDPTSWLNEYGHLNQQKLTEIVDQNSDEGKAVIEIFHSRSKQFIEGSAGSESEYPQVGPQVGTRPWHLKGLMAIKRVSNPHQLANSKQLFDNLKTSIGNVFEPGLHTRWLFHGTTHENIDLITKSPEGFMPGLALRGKAFGGGIYLARDAHFITESGYGDTASMVAADGSKFGFHNMLLCLTMTGIPTQGDPEYGLELPPRAPPYDSSVDNMASPEMHILQKTGSVYPAYIITFAEATTPQFPTGIDWSDFIPEA